MPQRASRFGRLWHCWQLCASGPIIGNLSRSTLRVKSDIVSALILRTKLKTASDGTSLIAREVGLDIADAVHTPILRPPIPGMTTPVLSHFLSRWESNASSPLPAPLRQARRRHLQGNPPIVANAMLIADAAVKRSVS